MAFFKQRPILRKLTGTVATLFFIGLLSVLGFAIVTYPKLPNPEQLREVKLQVPLRIYAKGGELIGEFGEKRRTPITFDEIPQNFINALLAAEDDNFFSHFGVSITGLFRAVYQLISTGSIQSGGSTITMQVARNFFLTREQTFVRKFTEILLALKIESKMSKNEILELYANKIYFGKRAYGIQAAANVYYGKMLNELNLSQLAMIAGLPKAPSRFNPVNNPDRAMIRRNWILSRMQLLNYINDETYEQFVAKPISASNHGAVLNYDAIFATEYIRRQLTRQFGNNVYEEGYQVYTTIDVNLQRTADTAVRKGILSYDQRHGYRGAEATFNINDVEDSEFEQIETPITPTTSLNLYTTSGATPTQILINQLQALPKAWSKQLRKFDSVGDLIPAVVLKVSSDSALVATNNETLTIGWEQGIKQAKPYISPDKRGLTPKSASDVLAVGDLIRLHQNNYQWHLSQLPEAQAALISLNPKNGAINAITGGFDFYQNNFNRVTQALRQPGSNFKPMLYSIAMENNFTAATLINDAPIVFEDANLEDFWRPTNDSGKFYGPTRLRHALTWSRNMVSIRILKNLGISKARRGMKRFGFDDEDLPQNLTLSLGSQAVTPLQIATAYATFANGGYKVSPYIIDYILDGNNREVFREYPATVCNPCLDEEVEAERILDERVVFIMDSIMKDIIQKGTGRRAKALQRKDIAGKTGTTNGPKDAWFSGYNPNIVTTTWLGFDNNQLLGRYEAGGSAALPIWIDFMREALKDKPQQFMQQPDNLVKVRIDKSTGLRASLDNDNAIFEYFLLENAPPELSSDSIESDNTTSLSEQIF